MSYQSTIFDWKDSKTWCPTISEFAQRYAKINGLENLGSIGFQEISWDDCAWLDKLRDALNIDLDDFINGLSNYLIGFKVRTYHGCRTTDVYEYLKNGILLNDPKKLKKIVSRMVNEEEAFLELRDRVDLLLEEFKSTNRDIGKLYLVLDDRFLISEAGHYLLYGSEWIMCLLGTYFYPALRSRGIPTIFSVAMPLNLISQSNRTELAKILLQEWTRIKINSLGIIPKKDFTFVLNEIIPPEMIEGHYHPRFLYDPHCGGVKRENKIITCSCCKNV